MKNCCRRLAVAGTFTALISVAPLLAASNAVAAPPVPWLTGEALQKALAQPVSVSWSGVPLRQALGSLSQSHRLAFVLDRRVDPGQRIEFAAANTPLDEVIQRIASRQKLGACLFGPVAYFGPVATTSRLRTVAALRAEELKSLQPAARAIFQRAKPCRWDDLATPRELLLGLATEAGLEIAGLEQAPHDLWAAADLPPLTLSDRLTLVAGQFDLTFEIDPAGPTVRLEPIPENVTIERNYPVGGRAQDVVSRLSKAVPEADLAMSGGKLTVRGRLEDHELIRAALSGQRPVRRTVTEGDTRYTVKFEATLEAILKKLESQGLTFQVDRDALREAGIDLGMVVQVTTKDATLDELLTAILEPAGLTFERKDKAVEIREMINDE